jgi:hypothetical protein
VVVFDRWDTCFLLSGPYITYISDALKNELRPHKNTAMQIDASEVFQPINPGDALIQKYEIIGPAPAGDYPPSLDGLELLAQSDFGSSGIPAFILEVRNTGNQSFEVLSGEVGPALMGKNQEFPFSPSDGNSVAWITRVDLALLTSAEYEINQVRYSVSYTEDSSERLPERFELKPGQSRKARIVFDLPSGEYQFMVGYGGGVHAQKSMASNAISFDVNRGGVATLANP